MSISTLNLSQYFARLRRDERGVSAVEFAMLLPLMLTLYVGTAEISQAVGADRKVTLTTRTVADLASQVKNITDADMKNLLDASGSVIMPYDSTKLKVTVSRVDVDASGTAKIVWSDTLAGGAVTKFAIHSKDAVVTLPGALKVANSSLIWGEVSYSYEPPLGQDILKYLGLPSGTIPLADQIYMAPRLSSVVTRGP
jgi:Flp pilus assembly protein TadG